MFIASLAIFAAFTIILVVEKIATAFFSVLQATFFLVPQELMPSIGPSVGVPEAAAQDLRAAAQ